MEWITRITSDSGRSKYMKNVEEIITLDETSDVEFWLYEDRMGRDLWEDGKINQKKGKQKRIVDVVGTTKNSVCYVEDGKFVSWIEVGTFKANMWKSDLKRFAKIEE